MKRCLIFCILIILSAGLSNALAIISDSQDDAQFSTDASFAYQIRVGGVVTRPDGTPVAGALVNLSSPGYGHGGYCTLNPGTYSTQLTSASGRYAFNPTPFTVSGGGPCKLKLSVSMYGYSSSESEIVISYPVQDYVQNVTNLAHLAMIDITSISTNLPNSPYVNLNQFFNVYPNVTNSGDYDLTNVTCVITGSGFNMSLSSIEHSLVSARGAKMYVFGAFANSVTGSGTITVDCQGTESFSGTTISDSNTITLIKETQAGGTNGALENTIALNSPATSVYVPVNGTGSVTNDGNADATNYNAEIKIVPGTDCNVSDVNSHFTTIDNINTVNSGTLIGGQTQTYTFSVRPDNSVNEGTYSVCLSGLGRDGNSRDVVYAPYAGASFTVDRTGPVVKLLAPLDKTYLNSSTVTFTFNASDVNGVGNCTVYINGTQTQQFSNSAGQHSFSANLINGAYRWNVSCSDLLLNPSGANATFTVDTVKPNITITSPAGGSFTGPSAFFNATTNENSSCVYGVNLSSMTAMQSSNSFNHSAILSNLTQGAKTYYVNCTDLAGNMANESVSWTVDTISPFVQILSPTEPAYINPARPEIYNVSATDTNGIGRAVWSIDGGLTNHSFAYNQSNVFFIDNIGSGLLDGNYTFRTWVFDVAGNMNTTSGTLYIDSIAPSLLIRSPLINDYFKATGFTADVFSNDSGSGIYNVTWSIDGGTNNSTFQTNSSGVFMDSRIWYGLAEGAYNLDIWSEDLAHNVNHSNVTFYMDYTSPTMIITEPISNQWCGMNTSFNVTVFDNFAVRTGIILGFFGPDINTVQNYSGNYYYSLLRENVSINITNASGGIDVHLQKVGSPYIAHAFVADGESAELSFFSSNVTINFTLISKTDANATLRINEILVSEIIDTTNSFNGTINTAVLGNGSGVFRATAYDVAGNANDSYVNIRYDHELPLVKILTPLVGTIFSKGDTVTVLANVTDLYSGVNESSVHVFVNGVDNGNLTYDSVSGTFKGSAHISSYGANTITVSAKDNASNKNSASMTVNAPRPVIIGGSGGGFSPEIYDFIFSIVPTGVNMISNESADFIVTIKNNGTKTLNGFDITTTDLAAGDYSTDAGENGTTIEPGRNKTIIFTIKPEALENGKHLISIQMGNSNFSKSGTITVEVLSPEESDLKLKAEDACLLAKRNIAQLESVEGIDVTNLSDALNGSLELIERGEYGKAYDTCSAIAGLTVQSFENGTVANITNPFTGFAIAVGSIAQKSAVSIIGGALTFALIIGGYLAIRAVRTGPTEEPKKTVEKDLKEKTSESGAQKDKTVDEVDLNKKWEIKHE